MDKPFETPGLFCNINAKVYCNNARYFIAPNEYNALLKENTPKYTFGAKLNHEKPSETPGLFKCNNYFHSPFS